MHVALLWRKIVDVRHLKRKVELAVEATVAVPTALHVTVVPGQCVEQVRVEEAQAWFATETELQVQNACRVVDAWLALRT